MCNTLSKCDRPNERSDHLLLLLALAIVSYGCRISGLWIMRYATVTPRLEAALRAAPLGVMVGVVAPNAIRGGLPEIGGLATVVVVMLWRRHDLLAALAGGVTVASLHYFLR
jgi:uncharacterized membrane protein